MKQAIKFSVLVPVYNTESFLDACISSVLNQSFADWELILVDDGSRDRSGEICDRYAKRDQRIKAFHKANEGALAARQFAFQNCTGDYLVFLDSDDALKPEALSVICDTIQQEDSDCVVYGFDRVENGTVGSRTREAAKKPYTETDKRRLYRKVFLDFSYNSLWRKAVRTDVFAGTDYAELFGLEYGEDAVQSLEIYRKCRRVTFIPESLYCYSINRNSAMFVRAMKKATSFLAREKTIEFLEDEGVFSSEDYRELYGYYIYDFCNELVSLGKAPFPDSEKLAAFEACRKSRLWQILSACDFNPSYLKDRRDRVYRYFKDGNNTALLREIRFIKLLSDVKQRVLKVKYSLQALMNRCSKPFEKERHG